MKKILGIACLAVLLSACARLDPVRPDSGPGSGIGGNYVPVIDPPPPPSQSYDELVAKCQREGAGLPFMKTEDHDAALFVVDTVAALGVGYWAFSRIENYTDLSYNWVTNKYVLSDVTSHSGINWISGAIAGGTTGIAMFSLFDAWVYSPQVAAWHRKQETQVANCMARNGFTNADPTVAVTYKPYSVDHAPKRVTGKDTYSAEKVAKLNNCAVNPIAKLVSKGPGYENHSVACSNGTVIVVHCEFGNCRVNEKVASN
jgi:hypothetical protein